MNSHMDHAPKMHLTGRLWGFPPQGIDGLDELDLPSPSYPKNHGFQVQNLRFSFGCPPFSGELFVKLWGGSKGCGQNPVSLVQVWYFKGYNLDTPPIN